MRETVNSTIKKRIDDYSNLLLGNKQVVTPYFINDKRRKDLRAMVGKGTPEEIVMEARIWEKLKGTHLENLDADQIKQFLTDRGLGIDCSGFIVHILDAYFIETKHKHVWSYLRVPNKGLFSQIRYKLRPVEQLGASIITNADNCFDVEINEVLTSDLIRCRSQRAHGDHIMMVTGVLRDANNNVQEIEYTHSTPHYGKLNGVKTGKIRITDRNKPLEDQDWLEIDEKGICQTKEGYITNKADNGIRRLKFI